MLDYHASLGVRYLVCSGAANGAVDYPALADELAALGEQAAAHGLTFCCHHGTRELTPPAGGGPLPIDILLASPFVRLEADVYWAECTELGAAGLLERCAGRCPLLHVCDMRDAVSRQRTEPGCGVADILGAVTAALAQGAEWLIVDQNEIYNDTAASVRTSAQNLRQLTMGL